MTGGGAGRGRQRAGHVLSPRAAELEAAGEGPLPCALEVERRGPCHRRCGTPNPGEGGGRAAGGARPAMATAWARAGGSAVPP